MDTAAIYSEQFEVRASEVDTSGKITLSSVCSLFQEVAGNHALLLNFDITDLHKQGLTWVLHRMDIKIHEYPKWRESITIETWPAAGDALRAYRNYRILNENGDEIAVCLSYWMMINMKTRRPTRMTQDILNTRLSDREHVLPINSSKIPKIEEPSSGKIIPVRRSDLDMNKHVNNARYLEWMEEPLNEGQIYRTNKVDIIFLRESVYGDTITSQIKAAEQASTFHQLKNQRDEIIALASFSDI
ncbi:MAG TPA: acyl-[acyl-carrier-protein] thioesterase [Balneola sp.]|nr:acyl-[acyl-carrier-protein] thioesterase [Bacteroidota bacterium]HCT54532.1 acyl-[acyl-carrier-protein] thioesterase [Balneola sp.]|tara:strand:- start:916 stop:1647 length:732 start_codon:yes stop_codon:yes gene_type:complete